MSAIAAGRPQPSPPGPAGPSVRIAPGNSCSSRFRATASAMTFAISRPRRRPQSRCAALLPVRDLRAAFACFRRFFDDAMTVLPLVKGPQQLRLEPLPPAPLPEAERGERQGTAPPPRLGEGAGGRGLSTGLSALVPLEDHHDLISVLAAIELPGAHQRLAGLELLVVGAEAQLQRVAVEGVDRGDGVVLAVLLAGHVDPLRRLAHVEPVPRRALDPPAVLPRERIGGEDELEVADQIGRAHV